ncbi:MAG: flagellar assembly protein FliX [Geminicoccaceae bacterium]
MRIQGYSRPDGRKRKRPAASGGVDGSRFSLPAGTTAENEAVEENQAPAAMTSLTSILAAQDVSQQETADDRGRRHGGQALDELHQIRMALLDGELSTGVVQRLTALLDRCREPVDDPKLAAALNEVRLRAAVELAKLDRARAR